MQGEVEGKSNGHSWDSKLRFFQGLPGAFTTVKPSTRFSSAPNLKAAADDQRLDRCHARRIQLDLKKGFCTIAKEINKRFWKRDKIRVIARLKRSSDSTPARMYQNQTFYYDS